LTKLVQIAISGKASSGKTTLTKALIKYFARIGWATIHLPLANPLKKMTAEIWPETRDIKDRALLFAMGEAIINIDQMAFCNRFKIGRDNAINSLGTSNKYKGILVVVDDMRMPHEYEFFREEGFLRVRTECSHNERIQRYYNLYGEFPSVEVSTHYSECALDGMTFDMVLDTERASADVIVTTVLMPYLIKMMGYNL
jgi:hypothetical protein